MPVEKRDFDKEAVTWDEKPARVKLVSDICAFLEKRRFTVFLMIGRRG